LVWRLWCMGWKLARSCCILVVEQLERLMTNGVNGWLGVVSCRLVEVVSYRLVEVVSYRLVVVVSYRLVVVVSYRPVEVVSCRLVEVVGHSWEAHSLVSCLMSILEDCSVERLGMMLELLAAPLGWKEHN
jgi:hypothetical protein